MKQIVTEEKHRHSRIMFGDFNSLLSITDRTYRQKINKEIEDLNNTIKQRDLTDIEYYTLKRQNMYSSRVHMEHATE
jgi:predicted DNA binding protein